MDRKEKAIELHSKGYNCAQAVLMAFEDKTGADSGMLMKLSEGFGGGMVLHTEPAELCREQ